MHVGNTVKVLGLRCKLGLKVLWRDKGSRYSFLGVLALTSFWVISELFFKAVDDPNYQFQNDPNSSIMIGVYIGSLLTCAIRISLIEYLIEKRKKMFSFLNCLGMSKFNYYSYHVFWNFIISLIMLLPFLFAISMVLGDKVSDSLGYLIFVTSLGCFANALYIMSLASFFSSEVTGLNVIGTVNFVLSIVSSMISKEGKLAWILNSNPQSKLVKMVELYATAPQEKRPLDFSEHLITFLVNIVAYFLIFCLIQNVSKNEYGYYPKHSLWTKLKKLIKPDTASATEQTSSAGDRDPEMSQIYTTHNPRELDRTKTSKDTHVKKGIGRDTDVGDQEEDHSRINSNMLNTSDEDTHHFQQEAKIALKIKQIKKSFGTNAVLDSVSFNLHKGEILCLLGPNGAGKSTLFNIILDNITPDAGSITSEEEGARISYCPQHDLGWEYLTVEEHFQVIEAIQEGIQTLPYGFADKIKDLTMLSSHWDTWCKNLSGGYKRRLTLALSLLTNSPIVLMDEPTTALDMEIRYSMMSGICSIRDTLKTTILYTTHHLEDAENFSDSILIMAKGSVLLQGSIEQLRQQFDVVTLKLYNVDQDQREQVKQFIQEGISTEVDFKEDGSGVNVRLQGCPPEILTGYVRHFEEELGLVVDIRQTSLEDVYVMDGQFENYGTVDTIGKVDMDDCWKNLISERRSPKYFNLFWLMLKKSKNLF